MAIIRLMLGPFTVVLDYFSADPTRLVHLLTIWAVIYLAGAFQLRRIEARSTQLLLNNLTSIKGRSGLSAEDIYEWFYPLWVNEFKKWNFWFIPHRTDLFPVRVTPERVAAKLSLSSDWLIKTLNKNGIMIDSVLEVAFADVIRQEGEGRSLP